MARSETSCMVFCIAFAAMLTVRSLASAQQMRCEITSKFACLPSGCVPEKLGMYNLIDLERRTISRCDRKGCDKYAANVTRLGMFIVVDVPGRGTFAKLSIDGSQYVEIATLGTGVLVSFGACSLQ